MANLDSSWQDAVVKLARAGNLQAIAFWMNHYLVPQGICVQAMTDQPGHLLLRVMCRRSPDRDRLVRFICHRLYKLNSEVIRSVHITAQLVGSADILWEKSAKIVPLPNSANSTESNTGNKANASSQAQVASSSTATLTAAQTIPDSPNRQVINGSDSTGPVLPQSFRLINVAASPTTHPSQPWTKTVLQQVADLQEGIGRSTRKSVRWFIQQKPRNRAFILGGSAAAAFLMGCSYELLSYHTVAFTGKLLETTTQEASSITYAGTVKTALESVRVIQQPVMNADERTITLLFSNQVVLSQTTPLATSVTHSDANSDTGTSDTPTALQADMVITNLEMPLLDRTAATTATPSTQSPSPTADSPTTQSISSSSTEFSESADLQLAPASESTDELDESESEVAESDDPSEQRSIELPEVTLQQLQANKVNVVNLASDRLIQGEATAFADTLKNLQQNQIYPIGAGENQKTARRPQIFSVKGKRIAYLGYSDSSFHSAGKETAGLNAPTNEEIEADIRSIRDQVDWVIVSYHWNQDLRAYPEEWQSNIAQAAIDYGADLVVGYHPAVTQGAEIYSGRAIVYALGSTLDEYEETPAGEFDTAALKVTLKDQQMQVELLPVQVKEGSVKVVTGEVGQSILDYLQQASSFFRQPLRSPTTLDARVRLSLPAAPDSDKPFSDPFISYPDLPQTPSP